MIYIYEALLFAVFFLELFDSYLIFSIVNNCVFSLIVLALLHGIEI